MRAWRSVLVAAAVAVGGLATPAAAAGEQQFRHTDPVGVTVRMSDGVTLVGDVIYPADPTTGQRADGRFPVLLVQNPYYCDTTESSLALATKSAAGSTYYAATATSSRSSACAAPAVPAASSTCGARASSRTGSSWCAGPCTGSTAATARSA